MPKTAPQLATLRKRASKVLRLPASAEALVERYLALHIERAQTNCPYHINCRLRSRNRALVGKGRPEEIEAAAAAFFKRFNTTITAGDSEGLKSALRDYGIGVDCSGFVAWVLNEVTKHQVHKPIWRCLRFSSVRRHAVSRVRPLENISAAMLTGERNTRTISDVRHIMPGDLLRALRGGHVIIVTEVGQDTTNHAQYFGYAHSTTGTVQVNGVSQGIVMLTNPSKQLADQQWYEGDAPVAPALKAVQAGGEDSRIVRLRALDRGADS